MQIRRLGLIRVAVNTRLYATRPSLRESHNRPHPSIRKPDAKSPQRREKRREGGKEMNRSKRKYFLWRGLYTKFKETNNI